MTQPDPERAWQTARQAVLSRKIGELDLETTGFEAGRIVLYMATEGMCEQLVAEANAERWNRNDSIDVLYMEGEMTDGSSLLGGQDGY